MEKPGYGWLLKWILAVILIAVGFTFFFGEELVYLVTGGVILVFSIFRIRSLIKTLNTEAQRTLNLIEILLNVLIGIVLVVVGFKAMNKEFEIDSTWNLVYKISLAFIFGLRAVVYLYSVTYLEEKSEKAKFWSHLLLLPLATVIITNKDFDAEWVGWLLLIVSLIGGVYLIYDGTGGYGKYRQYQAELNKSKEKTMREIEERENVIIDQNQDDDRPYIS